MPVTKVTTSGDDIAAIMIVDGDIISRHAIADYLRHCGYAVVEAGNTDEAVTALAASTLSIDVILCDVAAIGTRSAFELVAWVRQHRPKLEVRLAGNADKAASDAAEICGSGPHLARPYEPQTVIDYIKRLRANRARSE